MEVQPPPPPLTRRGRGTGVWHQVCCPPHGPWSHRPHGFAGGGKSQAIRGQLLPPHCRIRMSDNSRRRSPPPPRAVLEGLTTTGGGSPQRAVL